MRNHNTNYCFLLIVGIITTNIGTGAQLIFNSQIIYAQSIISEASNKTLEKVWETPSHLKNPESIAFDPNKNLLYVSNVDGKPDEKDNKGFISIISPINGSIINLNWVSNLDAPKGIDFDNNTGKIYVSDITNLISIDSATGKIINRYPAAVNSSLNDVVVDKHGNVFVSDPPNNSIFTLSADNSGGNNQSLHIWVKSKELNGPNGLVFDYGKNNIVVASMGKGSVGSEGTIHAIDLNNKTIINIGKEGLTVPIGILDGLQISSDGKSYYISDWAAKNVFIVNASGKGYHPLFNSQIQGIADFKIIHQKNNSIVIPLMLDNKIVSLQMTGN